MYYRKHRKQRSGRPIAARTLREMAETCDNFTALGAAPPLELTSGPMGPLLRLAGPYLGVYLAYTSSVVTARSGTTPGSGTVQLLTWDGDALGSLAGADAWPVRNWNDATGGIPSGKYCIILRIAATYWVLVAEC